MRKLTLDLDTLDVQSFDPTPAPEGPRGTVNGHESAACTGGGPACPSWYNEAGTCQVTDLATCVASCNSCGHSCAVGGYSCVTCNVACYEES